jgi:hypothetical protein
MACNRLRIRDGRHDEHRSAKSPPALARQQTVTVPVGDVIPWLADAALRRRAWVRDFEEDEITLSRDLYEVIIAYRHCRRSTA